MRGPRVSLGRGTGGSEPTGFICLANQEKPISLLPQLSHQKARPRVVGRWVPGTPIFPPLAEEANVQMSQLPLGVTPDPGT